MRPAPAIVLTVAGTMLAGLAINQLTGQLYAFPGDGAAPAALPCLTLLLRLVHVVAALAQNIPGLG